MRIHDLRLGYLTVVVGLSQTVAPPLLTAQGIEVGVTSVQFPAEDGITVFGELYRADRPLDAPLILLFHQGASNGRAEYASIAPRLNDAGYHALAIDQRRGGSRFGGVNRTLAAFSGDQVGYCEVMPDLEAAVAYASAQGFTGPRVAWGSSYSAALVFHLVVARPSAFAAILAFSPASGEPMEGCEPQQVSGDVAVPGLILRPAREMEIPRIREQLALFRSQGFQTHVADPGVHGSSMLNPERVGAGTEATWTVVLDFLRRAIAP